MTRRTLSLAAAIAFSAVSAPVAAQTCSVQPPTSPTTLTCSVTHNLTATVAKTAKLSLSSASTQISSATGPTVADFEASEGTGVGTQVTGPVFTAKSNTPYSVTFTYPATFTASTKSANSLSYSTNTTVGTCGATYTTLPAVPVAQSMIAAGSATASTQRQLCFRVKWIWTTDAPGAYVMPLTFNITAL